MDITLILPSNPQPIQNPPAFLQTTLFNELKIKLYRFLSTTVIILLKTLQSTTIQIHATLKKSSHFTNYQLPLNRKSRRRLKFNTIRRRHGANKQRKRYRKRNQKLIACKNGDFHGNIPPLQHVPHQSYQFLNQLKRAAEPLSHPLKKARRKPCKNLSPRNKPIDELKIAFQNTQSLRMDLKKDSFERYIVQNNLDILCLCETSLTEKETQKWLRFSPLSSDYVAIQDNNETHFQGTAIIIRRNLSNFIQSVKTIQGRLTSIYLKYQNCRVLLATIYMPPNPLSAPAEEAYENIEKTLKQLINFGRSENAHILLIGDWNSTVNPRIDRTALTNQPLRATAPEIPFFSYLLRRQFYDTFRLFYPNAVQYSYFSTRVCSRIDIAFSNQPENIRRCNYANAGIHSTHIAVEVTLSIPSTKTWSLHNESKWSVPTNCPDSTWLDYCNAIETNPHIQSINKRYNNTQSTPNHGGHFSQFVAILKRTAKQHLPINVTNSTRRKKHLTPKPYLDDIKELVKLKHSLCLQD